LGTPTAGEVLFHQNVATAAFTMNISGDNNIFKNVGIRHTGDAATSLSAVKLEGKSNLFEGCYILGIGGTTAGAEVACSALWIPAAGDHGKGSRFNDCTFTDGNAARTAVDGSIINFGTYGDDEGNLGGNMQFNNCRIWSRSDTDTVVMVGILSPMDGLHEWNNCTFYNHSVNQGTTLLAAFYVGRMGTYVHILRKCSFPRIAEVQTTDTGYIYTVDADAADTGGIPNEAT